MFGRATITLGIGPHSSIIVGVGYNMLGHSYATEGVINGGLVSVLCLSIYN